MIPVASRASGEAACPFCGRAAHSGPLRANCFVCGMAIAAHHFPHIVKIEPEAVPAHFCSLTCMENYGFLEVGETGD
ncbi:MAG TPA: hypothetical protein VIL58_04870 [Thermoplasmata archaeon]